GTGDFDIFFGFLCGGYCCKNWLFIIYIVFNEWAWRTPNAITFCHLVPEVEIPFDIVLIMTWTSFM
ncbi:hypothetical protein Q4468_10280, partial [Bacteroides caccae]|uniref:hypothetical protein n=1 Tax=Bacteroides caccae TaxID=47678 RepID=UPI0026E12EC2